MTAAALALLLSMGACRELPVATAGWKRISLSGASRQLRAPDGVPQFRSEDIVTVLEDARDLYQAGWAEGGSTTFEVDLGPGARAVRLEFKDSLRGAKVYITGGGMTLAREQRVRGATVSASWGAREVSRLWVRVHQHLREPPLLMRVTSERVVAARALGLPAKYAVQDSLYVYVATSGGVVRLCDEPGAPWSVTRAALDAAAARPPEDLPLVARERGGAGQSE